MNKMNYTLVLSFRQLQALETILSDVYIYDIVNAGGVDEEVFERLRTKVQTVFDDVYEI